MAKFIDNTKNKKDVKKTVFNRKVSMDSVSETVALPVDFDNVEFIRNSVVYGDIFFAWYEEDENDFTIFFGERGDEFD
jgi:hypothetical protein